jgi:hypothetical protein
MSGHPSVCFRAFLLFAGLSIVPAFSYPLTDLSKPAPKEAAAPAPEACVSRPGKSTVPGLHWVYHQDGHRKCWFEARVSVSVQKHVRRRPVKQLAAAAEENEAALRKKTARDAQDPIPPTAPADASWPTAQVPQGGDAAPGPVHEAVTLAAAAPERAERTLGRLTINEANPRLADMVLAVASLDENDATSSAPRAVAAPLLFEEDNDHGQLMVTRVGIVVIALGLGLLLGSVLSSRYLKSSREVARA